ncbi:MAG: MBL fold metallo-hydrolase [Candidatus Hydrogenedentes bacterium]|nr:MBL fold metallo-hydrolase [Candidatus Hydrogenedentota bacterium]
MKLTVLVDNNTLTDRYFYAEPGVSYLIEDAGVRVLFDVGYSDVFLSNATRMGLGLRDLDYIVLSHGHLDHTWGLTALLRLYLESTIEGIPFKRPVLVAHPEALTTRYLGGLPEIGSPFSADKLARHFDLHLSEGPVRLTERLLFLGGIDRRNSFEGRNPIGQLAPAGEEDEDYVVDDHVPDDTGLAYTSPDGLVLVVGCAHAGICNIVDQAKRLTGEDRVVDIIGGLHLQGGNCEQMGGTLEYIGGLGLRALHACHCTSLDAKVALAGAARLEEVGVGLVLEYE